jgi:dipeptidase
MKQIRFIQLTFFLIFLTFQATIQSQQLEDSQLNESCTSIMVGKDATDDGSVITAHTCDAYYRTWLEFVPAQEHKKGDMHKVYWGTMHTHTAWSQNGIELKGEIPQVEKTYAYLNTAYPCLNEKQLAIGETSIYGHDTLRNKNGMFLIEELERIALQRCTTARDAIKLIGELIKKYGYGDGGECITIADTKEVWQLEIYGEGPDKIGGVWAAQRIPDDHVGISANIARIAELDLKNKDYFMASENVFEIAKKFKLWDGKEKFSFWRVYGNYKTNFTIRDFYVLSTVAPSLRLKFDAEELPFSVKAEKKLNIRDILAFYRTNYEGTEYDLTKNLKYVKKEKGENGEEITDTIINPAAHHWMSWYRRAMLNDIKEDVAKRYRGISVQYCAYSWIAQLRDDLPDEIGGRIWFGFDVPRMSPRIPIYCKNLDLPESFKICGQDHFSRQSAVWAFRRASRLAMVKWGDAKEVIDPAVKEYEDKAMEEVEIIEKKALELLKKDEENAKNGKKTQLCREYLTNYSNNFARSAIDRWWEIGDELWVKMRWNF